MGNLDRLAHDFAREQPAGKEDIESYERRSARDFPASYREFLLEANGGERPVGESGYLMLWPLNAIEDHLKGYQFDLYAPEFLPIGSDGGGEALVVDYKTEPHQLGHIPVGDLPV